jgi:hypothetical protein
VDIPGAIEKLKSMMSSPDGQNKIGNIISALKNGGGGNNSPPNENENCGNNCESDTYENSQSGNNDAPEFDFEMFEKLKKVCSTMNLTNSEQTRFLMSLKPYLSKNRQTKLDSAIKMINISKVMRVMRNSNENNQLF